LALRERAHDVLALLGDDEEDQSRRHHDHREACGLGGNETVEEAQPQVVQALEHAGHLRCADTEPVRGSMHDLIR